MRFVWAVAAFVLATLMIATGIAQRTVFDGPKTQTATVHDSAGAPYALIDGAVLNSFTGSQTLRAAGRGQLFAAYGRTADVKAWLSPYSYTAVTLDKKGDVVSRVVKPAVTTKDATSSPSPAPTDATATAPGRNPSGSDLWLDQFTQDDILIQHLQLPATMSVLVATDGTKPAPADISVTWPRQSSTPWAGPLIVGGGVLMAVGAVLYVLGIRRMRRSRGPRRKAAPPLPPTEPIDLSVAESDKGVISAGSPAAADPRPNRTDRRRAVLALPVLALSTLMFAGCTADAWLQFGSASTPTPTTTVVDAEGAQPPAVTPTQADRILTRISTTVAKADQAKDAALAATRLDGPALAARQTNYTLRATVTDEPTPPAVPATGVKVILPQAYQGWPRAVMLVAGQKVASGTTSTIMMLVQHDPWSLYKLTYAGQLEATKLPAVAPAYVGAPAVQPDSSFLVMPPGQLATAYADVIDHGSKSTYASAFDIAGDPFLKVVAATRQKELDEFNQTAKDTGAMSFASAAGTSAPLALATLESGAIVAVNVQETETVKPTSAEAAIKLDNNPRVQALTGVKESATGFATTYGDQLFFYVPGVGSPGAQIRLLGFSSSILGAKVIG